MGCHAVAIESPFPIRTEITNYTFWGNPLEPSGSVFRERVMKGYVLFLIHIYFVPSCFIANLLSVEKNLQFFQDFLHRIEACSFAGIFNPRTRSTTCGGMSPNQTVFKVFSLILSLDSNVNYVNSLEFLKFVNFVNFVMAFLSLRTAAVYFWDAGGHGL